MSVIKENIKNTLPFVPGGLFVCQPKTELITFEILRGYTLEQAISTNLELYWLATGILGIAGLYINRQLKRQQAR